jgi:hypothetical protein
MGVVGQTTEGSGGSWRQHLLKRMEVVGHVVRPKTMEVVVVDANPRWSKRRNVMEGVVGVNPRRGT